MADCLISIGANVGDVSHTIEMALNRLDSHPAVTIAKRSRLHATKPVGGPPGQDDFVNAAVLLQTTLEPLALLALLQSLEVEAGRTRGIRWGERRLDLDIVFFGDQICNHEQLVVPHPRMAFRRFVLEPAAEIVPEMQHPMTSRSVAQMLDHINTAKNYVAVAGATNKNKTNLVEFACHRTGAIPVLSPRQTPQAESPSSGIDAELEFMRCCTNLLNEAVVHDDSRYVVSDFWIAESLAYAAEFLPTNERQLDTAFRDSLLRGTSPKLIVLVECQFDRESDAEIDRLERLQSQLRGLLLQTGQVPVLRLNAADADWNVEELVAAIHAM